MAGLHVRPSTGTAVFMLFVMFFGVFLCAVALPRFLMDVGPILGGFWSPCGAIGHKVARQTGSRRH